MHHKNVHIQQTKSCYRGLPQNHNTSYTQKGRLRDPLPHPPPLSPPILPPHQAYPRSSSPVTTVTQARNRSPIASSTAHTFPPTRLPRDLTDCMHVNVTAPQRPQTRKVRTKNAVYCYGYTDNRFPGHSFPHDICITIGKRMSGETIVIIVQNVRGWGRMSGVAIVRVSLL